MRGHARIVGAIVAKDLRALGRNRFFMLISMLGLAVYVAIFWVLPAHPDETIRIGVHQTGLDAFFAGFEQGQGLDVASYASEADLEQAVRSGEGGVAVGIDFPADFVAAVTEGHPVTVRVLLGAGVPPELRATVSGMVREMAYAAAGSAPPVTMPAESEMILGPDQAGNQVGLQQRFRPLLAFMVLLVETFALAMLVADEVQFRTATAVLVTPAGIGDFLLAKGIVGTSVAFGEAAVLSLAIGALGTSPQLVLVALLLGSVLVTGLGLAAGSTGRDFIGIVFISVLFLVPLMVPAVAALFPGTASTWVKALPSYGLVQAIVGATVQGAGWRESLPYLAGLAAWCVVAFTFGAFALRRKVATL